MQRVRGFLWLFLTFWLNNIACNAQEAIVNPQPQTTDSVTISKTINVKVGDVLRVKVTNLPANPSGKIAVFLGNTDITSQIEIAGDELIYRSSLVPLPVGEQTLTVYSTLLTDFWNTLASFSIKVSPAIAQVPTPGSTPSIEQPSTSTDGKPTVTETPGERASENQSAKKIVQFKPKLTINLKSQLLDNRTDRSRSQLSPLFSANFIGGLKTNHQINGTKLNTKFTVTGTTFQPEAFQFKEIQGRAPQFDLSEYAIEASNDNNQFAIGHLCFGNHPFLISNLCTRGISAKTKLNDFSDLAAAKISSSGIVGFDNILGIGRSENSLESVILGFQVARNQGNGIRLETTWMNGSRAPEPSFNIGEVVDAEESQGVGVRLIGGDDTGRLKADAGFANSTFINPAPQDPQLTGGLNVVPLQSVNKNAWYAEASYDLLKDIKIDRDRTLSASINLRTERIDPQFGTLGASLQADRLQTQYALNFDLAGATAQFQQNFSEDNLGNIPTLLRTNNRNTNVNLAFPLQTFLKTKNPLFPTITYSIAQSQQSGSIAVVAAPGGGFNNPSQIPNQGNTTNTVGLDWKLGDVRFNYKYATAFQDNRQIGRENADTRNITHLVSTDWQVNPQLRLNLGYNFVNANNSEQGITRFTNSPTIGLSWEFRPDLLFAFNYNHSTDADSFGRAFNRGESLELLLTWNFKINSLGRELPGSTFIRYGKQSTIDRNSLNNINNTASIDAISAGVSLSF